MGWSELPRGRFTGIDWSQPDATDGVDPYLVWAECDRFSGYRGEPGRWLPGVVELHAGCSIADLVDAAPRSVRVRPVYLSAAAPAGLRFCSVQVARPFFPAIGPGGHLQRLVKRFELGLPAGEQLLPPSNQRTPARPADPRPSSPQRLSGQVIGLIDDSLALAHASFLDGAGWPRTAFFWRQDSAGTGRIPAGLAYGHELTAADIAAAMRDNTHRGVCYEAGVYVDLGLSTLGQKARDGRVRFQALDLPRSHGTFVLDLAAGPLPLTSRVANLPPGFDAPPSWTAPADAASKCPVIAVQLDYDTVQDTSGGSMNVGILDGLLYILSRCDDQAQITVNISFGTLAGPHDGSSVLEGAMDQLTQLCGGRLRLVLAAGNGYQSRTHANLPLRASETASPWLHQHTLNWRVLPDDRTQSFLELWLAPGGAEVTIEVTPPGHAPLPPLRLGQSRLWSGGQGKPCCALIYPRRVATGERGTCALLALSPTHSFMPGVATAPSGRWRVRLTIHSGEAVVDAYIERDDVVPGTRGGGRQSFFEDRAYVIDNAEDTPSSPSLVRRSGSFNSIATGSQTISVGATRMSHTQTGLGVPDQKWARYSPRYPDPDSERPARPLVVKVPDDEGFGDENPALQGVTAAGSRSGSSVRLVGTSAGAPQVTRRLLNRSRTRRP